LIDLNQIDPAPIRYDLDEIVRRLRGGAERWVPALFPKGRAAAQELTKAAAHWHFVAERFDSRTDPEATILRLSEIRRARDD
jgi:hypothetical protein